MVVVDVAAVAVAAIIAVEDAGAAVTEAAATRGPADNVEDVAT